MTLDIPLANSIAMLATFKGLLHYDTGWFKLKIVCIAMFFLMMRICSHDLPCVIIS